VLYLTSFADPDNAKDLTRIDASTAIEAVDNAARTFYKVQATQMFAAPSPTSPATPTSISTTVAGTGEDKRPLAPGADKLLQCYEDLCAPQATLKLQCYEDLHDLDTHSLSDNDPSAGVCVYVCVCARERERARERQTDRQTDRQRERERVSA
jgi:hypothetical protein